jgi:hypothetical protein
MKKILLFISCFFACFSFVALAFGATSYCGTGDGNNDCDSAEMTTLIGSASEGDTIIIYNGTHTFASAVTVNKAVTITGNGSCSNCGDVRTPTGTWNTTISRSGAIFHLSVETDNGYTGRITGIHFSGSPGASYDTVCSNGLYFIGQQPDNVVKWRIDNNHFEPLDGGRTITICADGSYIDTGAGGYRTGPGYDGRNGYSVIDNNYFDHSNAVLQNASSISTQRAADLPGMGTNSYYTSEIAWLDTLTLGDENFVFVEDNSFDALPRTGGNHYVAIDCRRGGRNVFRYNYVHDMWLSNHGNDCAGNNGELGCQGHEIYENTIVATGSPGLVQTLSYRSGTMLLYNNDIDGTHQAVISAWERRLSQCSGTNWGQCGEGGVADGNWNAKDDGDCVGEYDPYGCCTGVGVGTCGDAYPDGYPCIGQFGFGHHLNGLHPDLQPQMPRIPGRFWNNDTSGCPDCSPFLSNSNPTYLVENRDYYYCADTSCGWVSTFTAGYSAYTYPHPLREEGGIPTGFTGVLVQ